MMHDQLSLHVVSHNPLLPHADWGIFQFHSSSVEFPTSLEEKKKKKRKKKMTIPGEM